MEAKYTNSDGEELALTVVVGPEAAAAAHVDAVFAAGGGGERRECGGLILDILGACLARTLKLLEFGGRV